MDIRDIKQEPPVVENEKYLEKIYELQKGLLDHYIKIEGLPPYPIDVNTKKSQVILKDFTGRVIEELAEGYESHLEVVKIMDSVGENLNLLSQEKYDMMISHLQNLNEEQADAMHFMVELLIYANIQPEDIHSWLEKKAKEYNVYLPKDNTDIIHIAMYLGSVQSREDYCTDNPCHPYFLPFESSPEVLNYIPGGREYNREEVLNMRKSLWDITYTLNIARNCLKNKPWKQSGVMTNEILYQSLLVEAFVYMMGYYARLGMSSYDIYYLYFKKNCINKFRIQSLY